MNDVRRSKMYGNTSNCHGDCDGHTIYSNGHPTIREIEILYSDKVIHEVNFFHSNGEMSSNGKISGGSVVWIVLDEDESITSIEGNEGDLIYNIKFITTKTEHGPYGSSSDPNFNCTFPKGYELKYCFSNFGEPKYLSRIGFAYGPIYQQKPKETVPHGSSYTYKFDDSEFSEGASAHITAITLFSKNCKAFIKGIKTEFDNGMVACHGIQLENAEDMARYEIGNDDYITGVSGIKGGAIDRISFTTALGKTLGPVGSTYEPPKESEPEHHFDEKFPTGSRLLYFKGYIHEGELVSLIFRYGSVTKSLLSYSKSVTMNAKAKAGQRSYYFEETDGGTKKIQKAYVYGADHIQGLQLMIDGIWYPSQHPPGTRKELFELDDDEYIVKITGKNKTDTHVCSLKFHTSKGNTSKEFGSPNSGDEEYQIYSDGSVIASIFTRCDDSEGVVQMAGVFVSGLITGIDLEKVTPDLEHRVVKTGFPYVIERIVMENKTDYEQNLTKELLLSETKSEVVSSRVPFSASVVAKGPSTATLKLQSGNSSLVGQKFLDAMTSGRSITNSKENKLLLSANVSGRGDVTATAFGRDMSVQIRYTADCRIRRAGSSKAEQKTISGVYTSVTTQTRVKYETGVKSDADHFATDDS